MVSPAYVKMATALFGYPGHPCNRALPGQANRSHTLYKKHQSVYMVRQSHPLLESPELPHTPAGDPAKHLFLQTAEDHLVPRAKFSHVPTKSIALFMLQVKFEFFCFQNFPTLDGNNTSNASEFDSCAENVFHCFGINSFCEVSLTFYF